jgi:uncharacterized glyoxalase superfamily protein PhnB
MSKAANPVPEGFRTVTPHLMVKGGAAKFIEFAQKAFGAEELGRAPGPGGKLMHAQIRVGDSMLMLADDFATEFGMPPLAEGRLPVVIHLYVPDADAAWAQALAAGCEVNFPIADQFWGDRYGQVRDPFGFVWSIATHAEDLTPEEMRQRQAQAMSGGHSA